MYTHVHTKMLVNTALCMETTTNLTIHYNGKIQYILLHITG